MSYIRKTVDIIISDKFRKVLKEIEVDSVIARNLLKKRLPVDMVNTGITHICLKGDLITYLTDDRIAGVDESELYTSTKRYQCKTGAFINKIFKDVNKSELEKFSIYLRTVLNVGKFTLKVVSGECIRDNYSEDVYSSEAGSLGESCMRDEECQNLMDVYVRSKQVSMLCMFDSDGLLLGRALLWNLGKRKIMDRIYVVNSRLEFFFKKWASENNHWFKASQSWGDTLHFTQFGKKKELLKLEVKLKKFDVYPYLDTFKFIDKKTGTLFNYKPEDSDSDYGTLTSCYGSICHISELTLDEYYNVYISTEDAYFLDYLDMRVSDSDIEWSRINDMYIHKSDYKYCEKRKDYIFKDETRNKEVSVLDAEKEDKEEKGFESSLFSNFSLLTNSYYGV